MKLTADLDAAQLQLKNAAVHRSSAEPSSPVEAQLYYDTDTKRLYFYNGTVWVPVPFAPAVVTLTDAATIATDASAGDHFRVTLGGNRTLGAPTNPSDGQRAVWEFIQDATGSRTITLNAVFALGTDITAVTLTTTANKRDFMGAIYNATAAKWYVVAFVKGY